MSAPGADPIAAIRQRAEQATPGPWRYSESGYDHSWMAHLSAVDSPDPMAVEWGGASREQDERDAAFVAHAREDIPFLLKQWDTHQSALRAIVAQMRQEMDARDAAEKQAMRDGVTAAAAYEKGRQLGTALVVGQLERLLSGPQP